MRLSQGRPAQCPLIVGLRGVGKTVLLNEFARRARGRDWVVVEHELTATSDVPPSPFRSFDDNLKRHFELERHEPRSQR